MTNKYRATVTVLDGHRFASKAEAWRYAELQMLEKAGRIRHLVLQPCYPLHAEGGALVGIYRADYEYLDVEANDAVVTEDVKGVRTALYRWKAKHFALEYGRAIREVQA